MSFFDQVYESLFPKKKQKNKLLLYELIKRSDSYMKKYEEWNQSDLRMLTLKEIVTAYQLKEQGILQKPDVHILKSRHSNGFAITFEPDMSSEGFQHLFDWFAHSVEKIGYKKSNSDVTIIHKGSFIETREKHYLKPAVDQDLPIGQKFGNILIEHIQIDGRPSFLKLMANTYSDRSYSEPENFERLMEYLFELT